MTWTRYRLKHLARINARTLAEDTPEDLEFRYIDISAVGRGRLVAEPQPMQFGDAPSRARRLVTVGDTILSTVRTYLRAVYPITEAADDVVVSTGFAVITPNPTVDPRFLAWWAQSDACVEEIVARSVGVSYPAINAADIGDLEIEMPPSAEQREIADFLDTETARIDALIEKKQRMIALLAAALTSRVIEATLSGPRRRRLRRLFERPTGGTWGSEPGEDGVDAACIRGTDFDMSTMRVKRDGPPTRSISRGEFGDRQLMSGDIVIEKSGGGDQQPVGRAVLFDLNIAAFPTNFAARLRPARGEVSEFLVYLLAGCYATGATRSAIKQTTGIQNLDMDAFLASEVSTVEPSEAQAVAQGLAVAHKRTRQLRLRLEHQIDLLREHRQALIIAVVTGQLDVSKAAA